MIKWAHLKAQDDRDLWLTNPNNSETPKAYWENWPWWIGAALLLLGTVPLDMMALSLLPLVSFIPLSGVTLILNAAITPWALHLVSACREGGSSCAGLCMPKFDLVGLLFVVLGVGLAVGFGSHSYQDVTPSDMGHKLTHPSTIGYQVSGWMLVAALVYTVKSTAFEQWIWKCRWFAIGIHGALTGWIGSQHLVFLKAFVGIVRTWFQAEDGLIHTTKDTWDDIRTYLFLGAAVVFSALQLKFLNEGLGIFDSVLYLPVFNIALMLLGMVCGFVVFDESMDSSHVGYYMLGIGFVVAGMMMLTQESAKASEIEADHEPSALDRIAKMPSTINSDKPDMYGTISTQHGSPPGNEGGWGPTTSSPQLDGGVVSPTLLYADSLNDYKPSLGGAIL